MITRSIFVTGFVIAVTCADLAAQDDTVRELIRLVGSSDVDEQIDAVVELGSRGVMSSPATPALVAALSTGNEILKHEIIVCLGDIGLGARGAAPQVQRFLNDESPLLRHAAIESTRKIGVSSPAVISRLRDLTRDKEPLTSSAAVWALIVLDPNSERTVQTRIPALIEALGNPEPHIRNDAALALAGIGPTAVERLTGALASDSRNVRLKACEALRLIGSDAEGAVAALTARLDDSDSLVVRQAALALGAVGSNASPAADRLAGLLSDQAAGVRADAAHGLAGIGASAPAVVDRLAAALRDANPGVRMAAAEALGGAGEAAARAVPVLVESLADPVGGVTASAADALAGIGAPAVPALAAKLRDAEYRELALIILGDAGADASSAVPAMLGLLQDPNEDVRRQTYITLSAIGPAAKAAAPTLLKILKDESQGKARRGAAYALTRIDPKSASSTLQSIVRNSADEELLRAASWALISSSPDDAKLAELALPHLRRALADQYELVRREAAMAIGLIGPRAASAAGDLADLVRNDGVAEVRAEALHALVELEADASVVIPVAVLCLQDADARLRNTARYALGSAGPKAAGATAALRETLRIGAPIDRMVSAWALVRIAPSEETTAAALPLMIEALGYPEARVRAEAAKMLGVIGGNSREARAALEQSLRDAEPEVREAARAALNAF